LEGSGIALGAQDVFWEKDCGAFTGQISPAMLAQIGCQYVIIGHSERRGRFGKDPGYGEGLLRHFGDTDESVKQKAKAALAVGLTPIICVGETLAEREAGGTERVVEGQVNRALQDLTADQVSGLVIAYEPVWAIGTGQTCDPDEANRVIALIRRTAAGSHGSEAAVKLRVQYGGSVTEENSAEIMAQPEIDGALVGGASLEAERFARLVLAGAKAASNRAG